MRSPDRAFSAVKIKYTGDDQKLKERFNQDLSKEENLNWEQYLSIQVRGKYLFFRPLYGTHVITGGAFVARNFRRNYGDPCQDPFDGLISILEKGFIKDYNGLCQANKAHNISLSSCPEFGRPSKKKERNGRKGVTWGDIYFMHFVPTEGKVSGKLPKRHGYGCTRLPDYSFAKYVPPSQILKIDIEIPEGTSEHKIKKKIDFYKREISKKHSVPVRLYINRFGITDFDDKGVYRLANKQVFPKKTYAGKDDLEKILRDSEKSTDVRIAKINFDEFIFLLNNQESDPELNADDARFAIYKQIKTLLKKYKSHAKEGMRVDYEVNRLHDSLQYFRENTKFSDKLKISGRLLMESSRLKNLAS